MPVAITATIRRPLHLPPVLSVRREDRLTPGRRGRAVERVGRGAPGLIVRRGAVSLERGHVLVDLVEVVDVLVLLVLQDVEPEAARLVALGAERVDLDRLEEPPLLVRLHAHLHPDRQHRVLLSSRHTASTVRRMVARSGDARRTKASARRTPRRHVDTGKKGRQKCACTSYALADRSSRTATAGASKPTQSRRVPS